MKKKLLSLLLVVAMLMTTVSMGFSSVVSLAAATGKGAETINAFQMTAGDILSASGTTTINVKSKLSNYNIRVNSIVAKVVLYKDTTSVLENKISVSVTSGTICTSAGTNFTATATAVDSSGLVRYECSYDLLNSDNSVAYSGLTGYGYGGIGIYGDKTGSYGPEHGEPTRKDDYYFDYFDDLRTYYINIASYTLSYKTKTEGDGNGTSSTNAGISISGNPPSTMSLKVSQIHWSGTGINETEYNEEPWLSWTEPASGYYTFSVYSAGLNGSATWDSEFFYRKNSDKTTAATTADTYLNKNLEKSYYTTETWNVYLAALDMAMIAARGIPDETFAYKTACQQAANTTALSTNLQNAESALVHASADYAAFNQAVANFNTAKNATAEVTTYVAGSTEWGSTTTALYDATAAASVQSYIDSVNRGYMKYDQNALDACTAQVISKTNSMAKASADYTYFNIAKAESEGFVEKEYTYDSWTSYKITADAALGIATNLKADSQNTVNQSVRSLIGAKNTLIRADADTAKLESGIAEGDEIKASTLLSTLDGYAEALERFNTAYDAAAVLMAEKSAGLLKSDRQAEVDAAADELAQAVNIMSSYRVLDTTILQKAIAKKYQATVYVRDEEGNITTKIENVTDSTKFESESYTAWQSLVREGSTFIAKAASTYTASDRKTYADYDEMVRLANMIIEACDGLKLVKADFTNLNAAVAKIPEDDVLNLYQDVYVEALKDLYSTIDYGATYAEQVLVDDLATSIEWCVAELTDEHLKPADYTAVDAAIEEFNSLDKTIRTQESLDAVQAEIDKVDRTKNIKAQADVDAYAAAINAAIANLQYIEADYSKVNEAIAAAEAVENKDWYGNYDRVQAEIDAVDWTLTVDKQATVDAYADAINKAVANLTVADADYSGVRDAIAEAEELEPLSDFTKESVDRLDLAISNVVAGYKKDQQAEVDAMEAEIRAALEAMQLLPADYSDADIAVSYARSFNPAEYTNYADVETAIAGIDRNLNCRQYDILNAQIQAVYTAVGNLNLLPANYDTLNQKIEDARYAYANGPYEYTEESIQAVEDVIAGIKWDYDIKHQADVDAYIPLIDAALGNLKYVRADYSGYDAMLKKYEAVDKSLYAGTDAVYSSIQLIPTDITIDRQAELDAMVDEINTALDNLEYADADYTVVNAGVARYNEIIREHYNEEDLAPVDEAYNAVVFGLKANEQARVTEMGQNLKDALDLLVTKIKPANLTALKNAVAAGREKYSEMYLTGYEIDQKSEAALLSSFREAEEIINAQNDISKQPEIDALTEKVIANTENLQYVFKIITEGTSVIIEGNYMYGFEEGTMSSQAEEIIKFVGEAEIKFVETRNGFGTGTVVQFINTDDGSILASYTVIVFGDANGDSVIDMFDVAYMCELISTFETPSESVLKALDVSADGYIDAADLTVLTSLANMDATLKQDGTMGTY